MNSNFFDRQITDTSADGYSGSDENNVSTIEPANNEELSEVDSCDDKEHALPNDVKRCYVTLLKKGVVLADKKPDLFFVIAKNHLLLRQHLSNLYLRLVLDERAGIAFVASIEEDNEEFEDLISLISKRTLSLYDTLVLLILRRHYQEREVTGEKKIVIDVDRIESKLIPFIALTNSQTSDRKKLIATLNKMVDKQVLVLLKDSNDRYEITPLIRYMASAEVLSKMLDDYLALAKEAGVEGVAKRKDTLDEQEEHECKGQQDELNLGAEGEA